MKKLSLFDKSEEIYNKLPKKYAEIILNSIIAKSLYNGDLLKECSYFLTTEEINKLSKNFNIKIEIVENIKTKKIKSSQEDVSKIHFDKKEEKKEVAMSSFEGFD